ncbi:MAG TPA: hypothetical protein VEI06_12050 [Gemmatimonadaceae bacterium]|jgi:hypothetical protein|nr:hypothetical protein [Gemmatimonadaceae bacterium]
MGWSRVALADLVLRAAAKPLAPTITPRHIGLRPGAPRSRRHERIVL